jgi:hypothetical protein
VWKQLFHALWKSFNADFAEILRNLREHRSLVESQVNITQFAEIMRTQNIARVALEKQKEEELLRRREVVYQWLSAANFQTDQETYTKVWQSYPSTGAYSAAQTVLIALESLMHSGRHKPNTLHLAR